MKPETGKEPKLEAYRGTKVTLTAATNRELREGQMVLETKGKVIPGVVCGEGNNSLRFELTLEEDTIYRIHFTATTGEINPEPYPYPIRVITDRAPTVTITKPAEEETSQPANGRLEVDARITDDQGIDTTTLRFQLAGKLLAPKPYQGGKTFKRDADGSYPTLVETKDSVSFADLKDEAGRKVTLKEGDVLEYWIEATDNCTVPAANVGKSKVQRVKVLPPETKPEPQKLQEQKASERKNEEQKHEQKQQERLNNEDRTPKLQQPQDKGEQNPDQGRPTRGSRTKGNPIKVSQARANPTKASPIKVNRTKGNPTKGSQARASPIKGSRTKGNLIKASPTRDSRTRVVSPTKVSRIRDNLIKASRTKVYLTKASQTRVSPTKVSRIRDNLIKDSRVGLARISQRWTNSNKMRSPSKPTRSPRRSTSRTPRQTRRRCSRPPKT